MKGNLPIGLLAVAVVAALLAIRGPSVRAQPVASITLPAPGATKQLYPGCNNISLTFPDGTASQTVVQAVTPAGAVEAMWRHNAALNAFEGFSPAAPQASDLLTVNFLDSVWLCVAAALPPAPTWPPAAPTATPVPPPAPTATPIPPPAGQTLSGQGQQATQTFQLVGGLAIFRMTHSGSSNFAIWLMNDRGERVELLVNEIGSFHGAKAVGVDTGNYLLDITADGPWTVTIEQPRPVSAPLPPQTFTGRGQDVSPFFSLGVGLVRFTMTHDGTSNFAIWLMNDRGEPIDLLVNEIGSFNGSKAVGMDVSGVYLLDITADGNWAINVE
jgi:hypothetical protein